MNQKYLKILTLSAMLISNVGLTVPAYSNTITEKMNVSADINASCIMSNTNLNFGEYNAIGINATQDLTANATITTTCTSGTTAYVTMDNGLHSTREQRIVGRSIRYTDSRHMSNAGSDSKLQYELYTNEDNTTVWHSNYAQYIDGSGASEDLTVYGRIPKNQKTVAAGSYADKVNITLTY